MNVYRARLDPQVWKVAAVVFLGPLMREMNLTGRERFALDD